MQVASAQFANHLQAQASKGLRSLYTFHGDEPLLQQEALDALRATARAQGYTERSVYTVAGAHFDWGEVLAAGGSMSLFADKQLIEIRIPSGKPGKDGSTALQHIAELAVDNDSTLTVVLLPRLDKATKSTAWFSALDNNGISVQIDPIERHALPTWIAQRLGAQQQRVATGEAGQHTLQFFAERVEGNLLAAHQEIQKLALLYPAGELSFEQVERAVLNVARYDVFKLCEAVLSGQPLRVQRMLDGLKGEGEAEVAEDEAGGAHAAAAGPVGARLRHRDVAEDDGDDLGGREEPEAGQGEPEDAEDERGRGERLGARRRGARWRGCRWGR